MVYYVRFLSGPAIQSGSIVGKITISSDLRERLLHQTITLSVSVSCKGGRRVSKLLQWKPGFFVLKFRLEVDKGLILHDYTICVAVQHGHQSWDCLSKPLGDKFPLAIVPVCSSAMSQADDVFYRTILLGDSNSKSLHLYERRSESIEGHIWYACE
jgi:hypothetical protein